ALDPGFDCIDPLAVLATMATNRITRSWLQFPPHLPAPRPTAGHLPCHYIGVEPLHVTLPAELGSLAHHRGRPRRYPQPHRLPDRHPSGKSECDGPHHTVSRAYFA